MTSRSDSSARSSPQDADLRRRLTAAAWRAALVALIAFTFFTVPAAIGGPEYPPVCPYVKPC